jgi:RNA polymerase sigma-70 factor (ECF subfamily)
MPDETQTTASAEGGRFTTTHWSAVIRAGHAEGVQAEEALSELCRVYWYPLYAFARRQGISPSEAEDLTQNFFARLLEKGFLAGADQEKGRFRTFLLTLFKRFRANEWNRQHTQKRGGFQTVVSIDAEWAESRFSAEPAHGEQPDVLFERQWALTLLDQVMAQLQREYVESGHATLFEHLEACLVRGEAALSYRETAARLNLTEAAVKMAVRRLRARYREILREEIQKTVSSPDEVEAEIQHLFAVFQR